MKRRKSDIVLLELMLMAIICLFSYYGWGFIEEIFYLNNSILKIIAIVFSVGNGILDMCLIYTIGYDFYEIALDIRDCIKIIRKK